MGRLAVVGRARTKTSALSKAGVCASSIEAARSRVARLPKVDLSMLTSFRQGSDIEHGSTHAIRPEADSALRDAIARSRTTRYPGGPLDVPTPDPWMNADQRTRCRHWCHIPAIRRSDAVERGGSGRAPVATPRRIMSVERDDRGTQYWATTEHAQALRVGYPFE